MPFCSKCGKKVEEEIKFCKHCGAKQNKETEEDETNEEEEDEDEKEEKSSKSERKSGGGGWIVLFILIILALLIWGYVGGQQAQQPGITCDMGIGETFCWQWHTNAIGQIGEALGNLMGSGA